MPTGQKIAFEPAFAEMLTEYFHDTTRWIDVIIDADRAAGKAAVFDIEHIVEAIRISFIRAEQSKIRRFSILNKHIAKHHPEPSSRLLMLGSRLLHFQRILAEIGYVQIVQNPATVCVRVRSYA